MMKTQTLRAACTSRILPIVAGLVFAATGAEALASAAGQAAINAKLSSNFIPTIKPGAVVTVQNATSADLLLALAFALEDPANAGLTAEEIAEGALEAVGGKVRGDKDKIVGQILATTLASRPAASLSAVASRLFNVNSAQSNTKLLLTTVGQANTAAAAIRAASDASAGNAVGVAIGGVFANTPDNKALETLLVNTSKSLGTNTAASAASLQGFVDGLFDQNEVPEASRAAFITAAAQKVAASNSAAAGAFFGGLVANNPAGAYDSNAELETLANSVLADSKLSRAHGDILASTTNGHTAKAALAGTLAAGKTSTTQALIAQGLTRAGNAGEAAAIVAAILPSATNRSQFAGIVATGNGGDSAKIKAIVDAIADNQDVATKTAIATAALTSTGAVAPTSGRDIAEAIIDSAGNSFADDASRTKLGTDIAPKLKAYASVGHLAAAITDRNIAGNSNPADEAATTAAAIMGKATKAATDIAQRVSALSQIADRASFADLLSDKNKKFVSNVAVGISITDPANSETITLRAITHDLTQSGTKVIGDTAALAQSPKIAAAVAAAVNEEEAADIAGALGNAMSLKGDTVAKPIKLSTANALASSLAKAIQSKPGVKTYNRIDELGEIAAALTAEVLGKNGTDSKGLSAEAKLLTAIGSSIIKALSKKPTLVNEYGTAAQRALLANRTQQADLTAAFDIAGSIAQTIRDSAITASQKDALIGTAPGTGILEKAFAKLAGKPGSAEFTAVTNAFIDVRSGAGATKFENGSVNDPETDTKNS